MMSHTGLALTQMVFLVFKIHNSLWVLFCVSHMYSQCSLQIERACHSDVGVAVITSELVRHSLNRSHA